MEEQQRGGGGKNSYHQDLNFANFSKQEILSLFHSGGGGRLYFVV